MRSFVLVSFAISSVFILHAPQVLGDCLGAGYARGNDPCDTKRSTRQNYFSDHNVHLPKKTEADLREEQRRMAEGQAIADRNAKLSRENSAEKAAEAEAARKKQEYEREMAMRQQAINAANRNAAATESAAAAAIHAANQAAAAADAANAASAQARKPRFCPPPAYPGGPVYCH